MVFVMVASLSSKSIASEKSFGKLLSLATSRGCDLESISMTSTQIPNYTMQKASRGRPFATELSF
jgi:hypothetical protein